MNTEQTYTRSFEDDVVDININCIEIQKYFANLSKLYEAGDATDENTFGVADYMVTIEILITMIELKYHQDFNKDMCDKVKKLAESLDISHLNEFE